MNPETPLEGGESAGQGLAIAGDPIAISRRARWRAVISRAVRRASVVSLGVASGIARNAAYVWRRVAQAVKAGAPRVGSGIAAAAAFLWRTARRAVQASAPRVGSGIAAAAAFLWRTARRAVQASAPRVGFSIAAAATFLWRTARRAVQASAPRVGFSIAAAATFLWRTARRAVLASAPRVGSGIAAAAAFLWRTARRAVQASAPRVGSGIAAAAAFLWRTARRAVQASAPRVGFSIAAAATFLWRTARRAVQASAPRVGFWIAAAAAFLWRTARRAVHSIPPPTAWPVGVLRYVRTRAHLVVEDALLALACIAVLSVLGMACNWWRLDVVLSGSMAPSMPPGAVVLAVAEPDSQVSVGQVLAFHPPADPNILVTHRVVQVVHVGDKVEIRTQGDANNAADQWTAVLQGTTAWHVTYAVPVVGYVAIWATVPWVRIVALLTFIGILAWVALARIWREEPR